MDLMVCCAVGLSEALVVGLVPVAADCMEPGFLPYGCTDSSRSVHRCCPVLSLLHCRCCATVTTTITIAAPVTVRLTLRHCHAYLSELSFKSARLKYSKVARWPTLHLSLQELLSTVLVSFEISNMPGMNSLLLRV